MSEKSLATEIKGAIAEIPTNSIRETIKEKQSKQ